MGETSQIQINRNVPLFLVLSLRSDARNGLGYAPEHASYFRHFSHFCLEVCLRKHFPLLTIEPPGAELIYGVWIAV